MENNVIKERLHKLRLVMEDKGIDYYMMPTCDYHSSEYVDDYFKVREYFCGFTGSNGTLLVGRQTAGLWTDGRYFIQAENELEGTGVTLYRMQEEGVPTIREYLADVLSQGQTFGFDGRVVEARIGIELEKTLEERKICFAYLEDLADQVWTDRPALPCHAVTVLPEELCGQTVEQKLARVRDEMRTCRAGSFLLSKLDDLMWLLNIRGKDVECNPVALSYGLFTEKESYLFIQKGEMTQEAYAHAEKYGILIRDYEDVVPFLAQYQFHGPVLCDSKNLNYLLYKTVSGRARTVDRRNPTQLLKAVKNPVELSHIEDVYVRDSAALTKFIYWLKKNAGRMEITEVSAAEHLDKLRSVLPGYLEPSFPTICGYKENAAMMHYEATAGHHKTVKAEGMLLVDSGGQYLGGTTDVTRTIVLGKVSEEIKKHFTLVTVGMLRLTGARFLYGCTGRNLDILARQPLWNIGIDYKCGTGHGIGYILNVHEGPQNIRWRFTEGMEEAVIEPGMLISNEPGVYKEGSHGIRTENIIVARQGEKNGDGQFMRFDTLTWAPIDLDGIDPRYMQPDDIEALNQYHQEVFRRVSPYLEDEERRWLKEATRPIGE